MLREGDIGAIEGTLKERWLNSLISPKTDRWHHFLVGEPTDDGDYEIFESGPQGVRMGRLSWYDGYNIKFYRYSDPDVARKSTLTASLFGRAEYNYIVYAALLWQAIKYWIRNGFRPVNYILFKEKLGRNLICTELVCVSYSKAGALLVPYNVVPTPAAIYASVNLGILREVIK
jgi:hypothetical protein